MPDPIIPYSYLFGVPEECLHKIGSHRVKRLKFLYAELSSPRCPRDRRDALRPVLSGLLAEIRFYLAWSANDFYQPGFWSVRLSTELEEEKKIDAEMCFTNSTLVSVQIKTGPGGVKANLEQGIILVRIRADDPYPVIRQKTIAALVAANEKIIVGDVRYEPRYA